ncbi:ATP-binding protein [Streptomyces sp. NPDC056909]|uniref:HAMP domain-containing sensor histidine kinase n=1 Tax=Streptomyces sp. NPDC056909 TaxID=3345963 RepID=UPI0036CC504B
MVSAVALIAVVAAVIGAVTTIAFRSYLYDQLDSQVTSIARRASGPPKAGPVGDGPVNGKGQVSGGVPTSGDGLPVGDGLPSGDGPGGAVLGGKDPLRIVSGGGAPVGTVGAVVAADGTISRAVVSFLQESDESWPPIADRPLTRAETAALATVPRDEDPHTVMLPGRGDYRIEYVTGENGDFLVGIPLTEVQNTLNTLVVVEICVTVAGLFAAGIAGGVLVGVALRPLRQVATTATRVSELPLHSGEVAPLERVPAAEADPRTEVGQVGAALNRMLGHVGSALAARQESEMRVRQFVADAGHELRTPLASIRGYAELTRRGRERPGPDTRHALGRIESEAERMTGLVEDLLLLARLDAGRPLSYENTDLSLLVVDAVSDARAAGQDHHWRLELPEPDAPAATVQGDASRLHQVLVNLLANARTHTPPGTTVTARVRRSDAGPALPRPALARPTLARPGLAGNSLAGCSLAGRSSVVLEVQDDGPGIPPALLPHVFERFARGDASRSRAAGSTGLGLAIVQAVVTAHGGTVDVRSVPGRTVFAVCLPASPAPYGTPQQPCPQAWLGPSPYGFRQSPHDSQTGHSLTTQA